jgi:hypothetical protein
VAADSDESALPTVAIDYAYLGDPAKDSEDKASPILVLRSGRDRWTYSEVYPAKGVQNPWCAKRLAVELAMLPWTRFIFKSDQEPAILALKAEALKILKVLAAKEVVLEESPVGDSQSNGLAECAVREVKGVVRSLRWALEELHGMKVENTSTVLPWLVRHAGSMISRTRRGADGRTAFELRKGRCYRRRLPPFGEKVLYLEAGKLKSQLQDRWHEGIFLGVQDRSDEVLVGTREGVFKARTLRRLDGVQRRDPDLVKSLRGVPWQPVPGEENAGEVGAAGQSPVIYIANEPVGEPAELPPPVAPRAFARRSLYVKKEDIEKYGSTAGCPGCIAIELGARAAAHGAECRARIEAAITADGDDKNRVSAAHARKRGDNMEVDPTRRPTAAAVAGAGAASSSSAAADPTANVGQIAGAKRPQVDDADWDDLAKRLRTAKSADVPMAARSGDAEMRGALMALGDPCVDVMEVFSPGRFTRKTGAFDLRGGMALDLRTGWNLSEPEQVKKAWEIWEESRPVLLVMSPMCKAFSVLQNLSKDSEKYRATLEEGVAHLKFCMEMAKAQLAAGRYFLYEHPWSAWSWKLKPVVEVMGLAGVLLVEGHQCAYGQASRDPDGQMRLAKKPTGWLTNCPCIAAVLSKRCANEGLPEDQHHRHASLMGSRASACERYPPKLVLAVLRALRSQRMLDGTVGALEVGLTVEEPDVLTTAAAGGVHKDVWDRISGQLMDGERVHKAREEEMVYMRMLKVFEYATLDEAREATGRAPISVDWVDVDKGDDSRPEYRSRLVAQETKWVTSLSPGLRGDTSSRGVEVHLVSGDDGVERGPICGPGDCLLGHQQGPLAQPGEESDLRQGLQGGRQLP